MTEIIIKGRGTKDLSSALPRPYQTLDMVRYGFHPNAPYNTLRTLYEFLALLASWWFDKLSFLAIFALIPAQKCLSPVN